MDVSKAIDKAAGVEREVVGSKLGRPGYSAKAADEGNCYGDGLSNGEAKCAITAPATDAARQWQGWGTALKPSLEPVTVARKPLVGTVAENVMRHGTGALNIDGCRIGNGDDRTKGGPPTKNPAGSQSIGGGWANDRDRATGGRWPANLIHDGSEEVLAAFPQAPGQSGAVTGNEPSSKTNAVYGQFNGRQATKPRGDSGSSARFFYCAKASKRDRDEGLDHLPEIHRVNGNKWTDQDYRVTRGERPPSAESGPRRNVHPTVKPTDLMRYLCRLVTPAGGVVLDPFAGSGSTGKAAVLEGFGFIGIERDEQYVEIARARISAVSAQKRLFA